MDVSAIPGMDLATMQALLGGGVALQQVNATATGLETVPTDAVTLAMTGKVLDQARSGLDVWA